MREIKFRAWEKNLKEIIPVYNIDFEKRMINTDLAWRTFDEVAVMQYTGLKDKNGKEIYEGDIVKIKWDKDEDVGIVKYLQNRFCVCEMKRHSPTDLGIALLEYEVLGNVYEHPVLLNTHSEQSVKQKGCIK